MAWQLLEKPVSVQPRDLIRDIAAATILLTRLPLRWERFSGSAPDLNLAIWAFPVVGAGVGLGGGIVYSVADGFGLPGLVAAALAVCVMVVLTGAMHEDGLADVADGFGGGLGVAAKLEIMRDSRVGAYGVIGIVMALVLRVGGLSVLDVSDAIVMLVVAGMVSRLGMTLVMRFMEPARNDGLAHDSGKPTQNRVLAGAAVTNVVSLVLLEAEVLVFTLIVAAVTCLAAAAFARRQINGFTGDVLGAIQQVTEIAVMLVLVSFYHGAT
jgi:adenosylcobinamide-GDP ribazoletransferase